MSVIRRSVISPRQTSHSPPPLLLSLPRGSGLARHGTPPTPPLPRKNNSTAACVCARVCVNVGQIELISISVADPREHKQEGDVHEEAGLGVLWL